MDIPIERPRLVRQLVERVYGENRNSLANELGFRIEFVNEILAGYEPRSEGENNQPTKVVSFKAR